MKSLESTGGDACTEMYRRFSGGDWTKQLPFHIRAMLGNNDFDKPLWQRRAMPPDGKIFELERFEDYLMSPFRQGLGFESWWTIHSTLETQGANGLRAIALIRKEVRDYDGKVKADRRRTLNDRDKLEDPGVNQYRGVANSNPSYSKGSTHRSYLVARLKRDAPDIADRLAAGEFKSARAAAIEAGIIAETPPLTWLRRWWKRATPEERSAFLAEIDQ